MLLPTTERLKRGRAAVISCERRDCNICLSACGFTAIRRGDDGAPFSDPGKCVGCGGCCAICPDMAIRLIKDRGDGSYELTLPYDGALPEIGDTVAVSPLTGGGAGPARVIQAVPKRPNAYSALVRAVADFI